VIILLLLASVAIAETTAAPAQPKPAAKPQPAVAKPSAAAPKAAARKPKATSLTEFEVSAYTSEIADQMNGRISLSRNEAVRRSWLKTGYALSKSRSFSKTKVNETRLGTFNVDFGYRGGGPKGYTFLTAVAGLRTRDPNLKGYPDRSGYYLLSAGYGKTLFSAFDCEFSLADLSRYTNDGDTERLITPVYTFRLRAPFSSSALLDGDLRLLQPFSEDPLVDLRLNMTYRLTSGMSLRLTYLANNLLNNLLVPTSSRPNTEWDKSFRIGLVFSRGTR